MCSVAASHSQLPHCNNNIHNNKVKISFCSEVFDKKSHAGLNQ